MVVFMTGMLPRALLMMLPLLLPMVLHKRDRFACGGFE
jgi:hypothetical protein